MTPQCSKCLQTGTHNCPGCSMWLCDQCSNPLMHNIYCPTKSLTWKSPSKITSGIVYKLEIIGIIFMSIGIISGGILMFMVPHGDTRIPGISVVIGFLIFMASMGIGFFRMITRSNRCI